MKPAADRGAMLQAALGTLVLLLLVFAWLSLGDAPRLQPATDSVSPPAPQAQTLSVEAPSVAPAAVVASPASQAATDAPNADSPAGASSAEPSPAAPASTLTPVAATGPAPAPPTSPEPPTAPKLAVADDPAAKADPVICPPAPAEAAQPAGRRFPPAPPSNGFMVQVGVFGDSEKAETLRRELARRGQPAYLQSRVLLGPFPDRKAAQQAEEKIRRERKLDGMILPPHKP